MYMSGLIAAPLLFLIEAVSWVDRVVEGRHCYLS